MPDTFAVGDAVWALTDPKKKIWMHGHVTRVEPARIRVKHDSITGKRISHFFKPEEVRKA